MFPERAIVKADEQGSLPSPLVSRRTTVVVPRHEYDYLNDEVIRLNRELIAARAEIAALKAQLEGSR